MKKFLALFLLSLIVIGSLAAQDFSLGKFPIGEWKDKEWDATWAFSSDTIKLYKGDELVFDFKGKFKDFDVEAGLKGVEMTFRCDETGRDYTFQNSLTDSDVRMIIDKDSGLHYEVDMKRQ